MSKPQRFPFLSNRQGRLTLTLLLFILFACAAEPEGLGQSGRRVRKPVSSPASVPLPPEPDPTPSPKPALQQQTIIVGLDSLGQSANIPLYMSDRVWTGFFERFREAPSVTITTDRNMSRSEANARAKKETESYVVQLQLGSERFDYGRTGIEQIDPDDLVLNYVVLSPVTAKVKAHGRVYARASRSVLGGQIPSIRGSDRQMLETGREAAARVMAVLNVGKGSGGRPPVME
jgi:hypothetical protein